VRRGVTDSEWGGESGDSRRGFRRTLALGAVASLGLPVALCLSQRLSGGPASSVAADSGLAVYWAVSAACLVVCIAPRRHRGLALLATLLCGALLLWWTPTLPALAVGLTVAVGLVRSGLVYGRVSLRALGIEALCGAGALGMAWVMYAPSALGAVLSLWGWFLAESCFYLLAELSSRRARMAADPFDLARAGLLELLQASRDDALRKTSQ
jgi:hypothetical protein